MTTVAIGFAMRATLHLTRVAPATNEIMQFGYNLHAREPGADQGDVIDACVDHFDQLASEDLISGCNLVSVSLAGWGTGPGFTGWHQVLTELRASSGASSNVLPPQIAIVHSLLNTGELGIAIGRRRSRIYVGGPGASCMTSDGKVQSTKRTAMLTAHTDFHNQLIGYGHGSITAGLEGLCVASPTEGVLMEADVHATGATFDTQRRRREHSPEVPVYGTLV